MTSRKNTRRGTVIATSVIASATLAAVLTAPQWSGGAVNEANADLSAAPGDLVWSDEFDGAAGQAPDPAHWNHETGDHGWGNNELQNYTDSRTNSALDGRGNLVITARQEADGSYTSARITTQNKVEHAFGRIEARIKIPTGQGVWPAFWMLGADFPRTPWPESGEIDVMENVGHEPGTVHGTVHGPGYSGGGGIGASYDHPTGGAFTDDFHVYAVDWSPGSLTWSVDGVAFNTLTAADVGGNPWVYDQSFFMILNVAVGGEWPGHPDGSTRFPQEMVVDYVRVYEN
ncbi:glycoside hydrolase family 16 protein [Nocardiopsis sp. ATB16-24]|uniref:glycoside hydrolase family 16 protein n=1 Tax=Nocardiopsis sp. ATB16-24 TaxID=3019555 RepID=UPI002556D235|nr:glycoside hydrolase family 16 protein [Nocardiopsis sp. ATB16-24]